MPTIRLAFDRSARTIDAAKLCNECGTQKSLSSFSKRSKSPDGLQAKCKECAAARKKIWDAENSVRVKRYAKVHGLMYREENKEKIAQAKQEYHAKNQRKIADKVLVWQRENRDKVNAKNREWNKANPLNYYVKNGRRTAARKNAVAAWGDSGKIAEFYKTAKGISMLTGEWHEVDHIVPLQSKIVCGLHCEANLQVLTKTQNVKKSNLIWPDMP